MGMEQEKNTVNIQFCTSVGRKSGRKVICYCAFCCEPGWAQCDGGTCHATDPRQAGGAHGAGLSLYPHGQRFSGWWRLEPL